MCDDISVCFVFHRPQHRSHTTKVCQEGMRELSTHPEKPPIPSNQVNGLRRGGAGGEPWLKQKNKHSIKRICIKFYTNTSRVRRVKQSHARDRRLSARVASSKVVNWRHAQGNDTQENECGLARHEGDTPERCSTCRQRDCRILNHRRGQRRDAEAAKRQEPGGIEDIAKFEGRGRIQTERRRQVHGSNFVPGRSERQRCRLSFVQPQRSSESGESRRTKATERDKSSSASANGKGKGSMPRRRGVAN